MTPARRSLRDDYGVTPEWLHLPAPFDASSLPPVLDGPDADFPGVRWPSDPNYLDAATAA